MIDKLLFHKHLEDEEVIARIVHKHWLIGLKFLFWPSVSFLLSWVSLALVYQYRFLVLLVALWSIWSVVWWLRCFFDYYLDAWIVTNMGIIDLEWHGWFHRQSTRVLYSDIQGVSYEINGVLGTMLRFGTVSVEKISTGSVIALSSVGKPRSVEALILSNMEGYLHSKNLKNARHVQELLAGYVATQVQMTDAAPPAQKKK